MELNFDKEIDAILRKARESESAFTAAANSPSHLDADEISAFAENALPEQAKMRYTAHLADCERCRKILSSVVLLNSETKSEIVHADEKTVAAPVVPWYRRLFQFPNLAYSLGALALLFGGIIAFTALQSLDTFQNAEISQVSNKPSEMTKSAPATQSNANSSTSNTANISPANAPANVVSAPVFSSNTTTVPDGPTTNSNTNPALAKPNDAPVVTREAPTSDSDLTLAKPSKDDAFRGGVADDKQQKEEEDRKRAENKKDADDKTITDGTSSEQTTTQQDAPSVSGASKNARKMSEKAKTLGATDGETTKAGGRTFRRANNVWYDTAYNNQATTNVTRGTSEYKKLDKDLRVIVENLGGTVVIVWKGKAYRIR
jgi:hypothetical protein